jgi:hypothetical protein
MTVVKSMESCDSENTYISKHFMQRLEFMGRSKYLTLDPYAVEVGLYKA